MARVYVITETEMKALLDRLELQSMIDKNIIIGGGFKKFLELSPDEQNRLNGVHRSFHHVVVTWAQEMGFKGY